MFFRALLLAMTFAWPIKPCHYPGCLEWKNYDKMENHWNEKHRKDGKFACTACWKAFNRRQSLLKHFAGNDHHGLSYADRIASNNAARRDAQAAQAPQFTITPIESSMGGSGFNDVPTSMEGSERLDLGTHPSATNRIHWPSQSTEQGEAQNRARRSTEPRGQDLLTPRGGLAEAHNFHPSFLPAGGAGRISAFGTDVGSPAATGKTDPLIANRNTNNPLVERRKSSSADGVGSQHRSSPSGSSLLKNPRNIVGATKNNPFDPRSGSTKNNPSRLPRKSSSADGAGSHGAGSHRLSQPSSLGHDAAMSVPEFDESLLPPQQPSSLDHGTETWLSDFDLSKFDR